MKRLAILGLLLATAARAQLGPKAATHAKPVLSYPPTERRELVEQHFGLSVSDPYRWLEDGKDQKVRDWAAAEDKLTRAELGKLPRRAALTARARELVYVDSLGLPVRGGQRLFLSRTAATAEKGKIYVRGPGGSERVVIDPLQLAADGTVSVPRFEPSLDGGKIAYTRSVNNGDEATLYIRDAQSGQDLPEHIDGTKWGIISWNPNGEGLWYMLYPLGVPETERIAKAELRYHKLGTDPKNDPVVHHPTGSSQAFPSGWVSRDGHWLFYAVERDSNENDLWVRDLRKPDSPFQVLVKGLPAYSDVVAWNDRFYVKTNHLAPRGRVVLMDPAQPGFDQAKELVAESPALLEEASIVGGMLVLRYLRNAVSELEIHDLDGKLLRKVDLPGIGSVEAMSGVPEKNELFFSFSSPTIPQRIYRASVEADKLELFGEVKVPMDASSFVTEQVWYPSKDGTRISMFLVRRNDLKRNGKNPVLLSGYGGFGINVTPKFSAFVAAFLQAGGMMAIPNLRGGGEYGEPWHKAGIKAKKQNVFDDFIAAAEWLVKQRYTTSARLAITGRSNGGLLTSTVLTQRPELFAAVIIGVPLTDMLRYTKFGIAQLWASEYGGPESDADFKILAAYSPYHHVEARAYPPVLVLGTDSDDRVDPMHARKLAAALQAANTAKTRILLRVESHAGHSGSDQRAQDLAELADRLSFLMQELKMARR